MDDEGRQYMHQSIELKREEEMMEDIRGFKKKYTFTQRKAATIYHCELCNKVSVAYFL